MGIILALISAQILGTVASYLLGLGRLGPKWHFGIGFAGLMLGWVFVTILPLPHLVRIAVNSTTIYPVWGALGAFMAAAAVGLFMPDDEGGRRG